MKFQSMPVKRRPKKKGAFRTLFANVANKRKRQRASTAAIPAGDLDGDVPNLGVARALVVILVIHVVAIAGIFFHSHWLDGESGKEVAEATQVKPIAVALAPREDDGMPKIRSGDSIYTIGTGDTYENIARRLGVDEAELREANGDVDLSPQVMYLRIPSKKIVAVEPEEITSVRESSNAPSFEAPPAVDPGPPMIPTAAALRADAAPARATAESTTAGSGSSATHVVKSGDTLWSISRKYGSTVDAVMKANGISNARHLKIGMSLTVPQ
ncbi:LysM peptidoglycan-binding domain-containing protein [Haloferula chungangensis]|uniref:LysM peptidoglycan-binding domain-containing protein n=1 Tax=Haloferula chungangensis TaxID=1048331 RepID=A0ABW2LBS6_9BACT